MCGSFSAVMINNSKIVTVRRLSKEAVMPSKSATGYTLVSPKAMILPAWTSDIMVPTDLEITVPSGVTFQIARIPGIAWQTHSRMLGRFVPANKVSEVVCLKMLNDEDFDIEIKKGDPIGQLLVIGGYPVELVEVPPKNPRFVEHLVKDDPKIPRIDY